jgi:hypothetical protein
MSAPILNVNVGLLGHIDRHEWRRASGGTSRRAAAVSVQLLPATHAALTLQRQDEPGPRSEHHSQHSCA